ncbi:MAG: transcriptional repressor [Candidatus Heimdallarchaeota archaeon]|nr:transcriptional repressor [Candidatus Heimdallarchaeota archaeon]
MFEKIVEKLKKSGYKLTPQRLEIIRILVANAKGHLSHNEIYTIAKGKLRTVSFSTLYNTLQLLEELGIIRQFNIQGETRIELNMVSHINLIQQNKNSITDVDDESLIQEIANRLKINDKSKTILVNVILYDNTDSSKE